MSHARTKENGNGNLVQADTGPRSWSSAPVDILESPEAYLVFADVPGVQNEDLDVEYSGGEIRLRATRKTSEEAFEYLRTFSVGRDVDVEQISAELQNGVLQLKLPKSESAKPRQISIREG